MNRYVTTEDTWMEDKHMKRYSTSLVVRKMKIKSAMGYHYTAIRMVQILKTYNMEVYMEVLQ